jgi:putative hemolysin
MKESPNPTFALSPVQLPGGAIHTGSAVTGLDFLPQRLQSSFEVSWAQHLDEVREAQRLRYQVFAN